VKDLGRALVRLKLDLQRIVTSPLPRARRTAEIVARELRLTEVLEECETLTSGTPARAIRDWLAGRDEERLMIVGHNPDLTALVGCLRGLNSAALPFDLKKGGMAALVAGAAGGFELEWLATPGLVRKLAH